MDIGIKEAKNCLSRLVLAVEEGDRVFLTNRGRRVIELVPVKDRAHTKQARGLGMYKHISLPPDFGSTEQRRKATASVRKMMGLKSEE